jgi:hypothetical protein
MNSNVRIARIAHEVNRAYCLSIGDASQPAWEEAPQWQKDSAIAGVDAHLANPKISPKESHEAWLIHKLEDGWVFGPVKDPVAKQHPCIVPYELLPQEQRTKDYLFGAVVRSAAGTLPG